MTQATSTVLGPIPCVLCGETVALRESKSGLSHYGCPECGCQVLTKGRPADRNLRSRLKPAAAPAATPTTKKPETPKREERPAAAATKPATGGQPAAAGTKWTF